MAMPFGQHGAHLIKNESPHRPNQVCTTVFQVSRRRSYRSTVPHTVGVSPPVTYRYPLTCAAAQLSLTCEGMDAASCHSSTTISRTSDETSINVYQDHTSPLDPQSTPNRATYHQYSTSTLPERGRSTPETQARCVACSSQSQAAVAQLQEFGAHTAKRLDLHLSVSLCFENDSQDPLLSKSSSNRSCPHTVM